MTFLYYARRNRVRNEDLSTFDIHGKNDALQKSSRQARASV